MEAKAKMKTKFSSPAESRSQRDEGEKENFILFDFILFKNIKKKLKFQIRKSP